jgi:SAM-dependent methyltransferase
MPVRFRSVASRRKRHPARSCSRTLFAVSVGKGDPKRIVEAGYDRIGPSYRPWSDEAMSNDVRGEYLQDVVTRLPKDADVLELGCGPGADAAQLARERRYLGVDLSSVQLDIALAHVPNGSFLHADITALQLPANSFDAVVAFYVFNHVPGAEQGPMFVKIYAWLRPGAFFCASLGAGEHEDLVQDDWLGVPMFFASIGRDENERLLGEAGFQLERSELRTELEEDGEVSFHWVIARKTN